MDDRASLEGPKTGKRCDLGTFDTAGQAEQHEREVPYFKRRQEAD
ncbi:MAG TPA: hypothetical protein VGM81_01795 [Burkholderiaceae bacterium]|jgi:hypothetical protein